MVTPQNYFTLELLHTIGEPTTAAIPSLIDGLRRVEPIFRAAFFELLCQLGVDAVPHLIGLLAEDDSDVRQQAAGALGKIRAAPEKACPALLEALSDADASVRLAAAQALADFNAAAERALPVLINYVHAAVTPGASSDYDEEPYCIDVICAIARFSPPRAESIAAINFALSARSRHIKQAAADALGEMGAASFTSIPALAAIVAEPIVSDSAAARIMLVSLRIAAAKAIRRINGDGYGSLLLEIAENPHEWSLNRVAAVNALANARVDTEIAAILKKLASDNSQDSLLRRAAEQIVDGLDGWQGRNALPNA